MYPDPTTWSIGVLYKEYLYWIRSTSNRRCCTQRGIFTSPYRHNNITFSDVVLAKGASPYLQGSIKPLNMAWRSLVNKAPFYTVFSVKGGTPLCFPVNPEFGAWQ